MVGIYDMCAYLSGWEGPTAGAAIASHMDIDKVAFTGSTEVGNGGDAVVSAGCTMGRKEVKLKFAKDGCGF